MKMLSQKLLCLKTRNVCRGNLLLGGTLGTLRILAFQNWKLAFQFRCASFNEAKDVNNFKNSKYMLCQIRCMERLERLER